MNLTVNARIWDDEAGQARWVVLSAFCRLCGRRRGCPQSVLRDVGGREEWLSRWTNPCGHADTDATLRDEVALQCAREECVVMASMDEDSFAPYCSAVCAAIVNPGPTMATLRARQAEMVSMQQKLAATAARLAETRKKIDPNHLIAAAVRQAPPGRGLREMVAAQAEVLRRAPDAVGQELKDMGPSGRAELAGWLNAVADYITGVGGYDDADYADLLLSHPAH